MEHQSVSAEDLAASIVEVALALGVSISSSADDLAALQNEIETQLGNNAERVLALAEKQARGLRSDKEVKKLARTLHAVPSVSSDIHQPVGGSIQPAVSPNYPANTNVFSFRSTTPIAHWSHQSALADKKIVTSRRGAAPVIRGPGRHSGK